MNIIPRPAVHENDGVYITLNREECLSLLNDLEGIELVNGTDGTPALLALKGSLGSTMIETKQAGFVEFDCGGQEH